MKIEIPEIVRKGISLLLILFCGFQILRMLRAYLEWGMVKNPLLPHSLGVGIRNYIIFFSTIYLLVAAANCWSWYAKNAFYAVSALSVLVFVAIQLLSASIINFFLNHPLG